MKNKIFEKVKSQLTIIVQMHKNNTFICIM